MLPIILLLEKAIVSSRLNLIMRRGLQKVSFFACINFSILFVGSVCGQATFTSNQSGNWNVSSTWTTSNGTDAGGIPDANAIVQITGGHTVSVSDSRAASSITFSSSTNPNCCHKRRVIKQKIRPCAGFFVLPR